MGSFVHLRNRNRLSSHVLPDVLPGLVTGCLPCRNDSDDLVALPIAVANSEKPCARTAQSDNQESLLIDRVIRIINQESPFIAEHRLGFVKRNAVLALVL